MFSQPVGSRFTQVIYQIPLDTLSDNKINDGITVKTVRKKRATDLRNHNLGTFFSRSEVNMKMAH